MLVVGSVFQRVSRPGKMMIGRRSFTFLGSAYFRAYLKVPGSTTAHAVVFVGLLCCHRGLKIRCRSPFIRGFCMNHTLFLGYHLAKNIRGIDEFLVNAPVGIENIPLFTGF